MKNPKPVKRAFAITRGKGKNDQPEIHFSGSGRMADQIIDLAKKSGIPVNDDPNLVEALSRVNIDQDIPPEFYSLIDEILGFAYRLNDSMAQEEPESTPPIIA